MSGSASLLLWGAIGLVVLLAGAVVLLVATGSGAKQRQRRIDALLAPHQRAAVVEAQRVHAGRLLWDRVAAWFAALVAYRPERAANYPMRGWLVLLLALPLARAVTGLLAAVVGDAGLLATPVLWLLLVRVAFLGFEQKRLDALYRQLPDALSMIVRAARVGIPVTEAIRAVAREAPQPTAGEFGFLADRLSIGVPLPDALIATARQSGLPEYGFFATALILQNQTGGGLSETLDNLADVIRRRVALRSRAIALASEARTSAMILTALPAVAAAALAVISPDYLRLLYADEGGQQIAALAIGMIGAGAYIMRSIIRRSLG